MRRPPKKWFYDTLKALSKNPKIKDAKGAVANIWYHKLTAAKKRMILKAEEKGKKAGRKLGTYPGCKKTENAATSGKYKKGKKRLSDKQKRALAKGRKVLNYIRTGRHVSEPLEPILIKEGFLMAKGKGKKKHGKKTHGMAGMEGKGKVRVIHKVLHGDPGPGGLGLGVDIAGLLAGAIGLSFVASFIPIKQPKIKALIPIIAGLAGLFVPAVNKNRFANRAALGAIAIGSYSMTKQLVPQIPLMGAADTAEGIGNAIMALPPEEKAILGILPENAPQAAGSQQPGEMLGTDVISGNEPGEMLGTDVISGSQEAGEMLGADEMEGTEVISGEASDFE